ALVYFGALDEALEQLDRWLRVQQTSDLHTEQRFVAMYALEQVGRQGTADQRRRAIEIAAAFVERSRPSHMPSLQKVLQAMRIVGLCGSRDDLPRFAAWTAGLPAAYRASQQTYVDRIEAAGDDRATVLRPQLQTAVDRLVELGLLPSGDYAAQL